MFRIGLIVSVLFVLAGCSADISVAKRELDVVKDHGIGTSSNVEYDTAINYAGALTNAYLDEAAKASRGRDGAFLGILAIGTFAGYRAVDGASTTELARTALFGAAANQAVGYYSPGGNSQKLVRGANRTACVMNAGAAFKADLLGSSFYSPAAILMVSTLEKVRANLRSELANQPVDYSTIANAIEQAAKEKQKAGETTKSEEDAATQARNSAPLIAGIALRDPAIEKVAKKKFAEFKVVVEKCPAA